MSKNPTFYLKESDTRRRLAVALDLEPTDVISSVAFYMRDSAGTVKVNGSAGLILEQPSADSGGIVAYQ